MDRSAFLNNDSGSHALIQECIDADKENPASIANNVLKMNYEGVMVVHQSHALGDYANIVAANLVDATISESSFYHPERVSKEVYGTTDLWWLVLFCNNMSSIFDFNKKSVRLFDPARVSLLARLLSFGSERASKNNANPPLVKDITLKRF